MRVPRPRSSPVHARTALRESVYHVSFMVLGIGLVYGLDSALH
jgi:hypothetical protein